MRVTLRECQPTDEYQDDIGNVRQPNRAQRRAIGAGEDEWEFPQTPGGLTGPVSTKLWASPAVSPLPPPQAMGEISVRVT